MKWQNWIGNPGPSFTPESAPFPWGLAAYTNQKRNPLKMSDGIPEPWTNASARRGRDQAILRPPNTIMFKREIVTGHSRYLPVHVRSSEVWTPFSEPPARPHCPTAGCSRGMGEQGWRNGAGWRQSHQLDLHFIASLLLLLPV